MQKQCQQELQAGGAPEKATRITTTIPAEETATHMGAACSSAKNAPRQPSPERGTHQGPFTNTVRTPTDKSVWGINEAHEQYSLLDTVFDYIFILDLQENIYT